jgi:hypothetical protein
MARKCGSCGEAGHNSRNCPADEGAKAEAKRQASLPKPTEIHIAISGAEKLCGATSTEWPDKYCTDEFAKKLPVCDACQATYQKQFKRPFTRPTVSEKVDE